MKKIVCYLMVACILICGTACGNGTSGIRGSRSRLFNQKDDAESNVSEVNSICGRWEVVSVELDGSVFTMDEVRAMGDHSMDNTYFIIKEGGKVYMHSQDEGELIDWKETDNGVKIGQQELTYDGDKLVLEMKGKMFFEKVSDDQTITADQDSDETEVDESDEAVLEDIDDEDTDDEVTEEYNEEDENDEISSEVEEYAVKIGENDDPHPKSDFVRIDLPKSTGAEVEENDFVAEILEDDTVIITKYDTFDDECTGIPSEISGHVVIAIGEGAFSYKEFDNLVMPDSVKVIDESAFSYTKIKTSIELPAAIEIGDNAFFSASFPDEVLIPKDSYVSKQAFAYADFDTVTIADNVTLDNEAFYYSELKNLLISSGDIISESAFFACSELKTIGGSDIGDNTKGSIGKQAFAYCDGLETVNIPAYIVSIDEEGFYHSHISECLSFDGSIDIGDRTFFACECKGSITIPKESTIGKEAFAYSSDYEELTIDDSSVVKKEAFAHAEDIKTVIVGKSVEIGDEAFYCNDALETLTVGEGSSLGKEAFGYCSSIKNKDIDESVSISDDTF